MGEKLKPCPRCGGEIRTYNSDDNAAGYTWSVMCVNPECIDQEVFATKEAAVAAANRRTPGPATAAMVEELKSAWPVIGVESARVFLHAAPVRAFIAEHEPRP